ncbi:MAG: hypothetical protein WCO56_15810 [Verrucomicrobiota bacterium]
MSMTRRNHLKLLATAAGAAALGGNLAMAKETSMKKVKLPKYKNADFYVDGKFQAEAAKKAYLDMMERHGYYLPLEQEKMWATPFWVTDFGLGDFVNVGMGGIFWFNSQEYNYFAHEIFLFPGQMIVEHAHEATAKGKAKMESWQVRHGSVHAFGEEGEEKPADLILPASQEKFMTVKKCYEILPGQMRSLNRLTAKHFMIGGPSGAVVSEYASFHDNDGLRFTNPGVKF